MQFFVGTSGFSYKEWKGSFYPAKLPTKEMLAFYAERFSTVEMNNTHYRFPTRDVVESWAQQTPSTFRFVLKAHQTITHRKRLKGVEQNVEDFLGVAAALGDRQGPLLFQLPPNFKKDVPRLNDVLGLVRGRAQVAFEFRHESWFDDEVFESLRENNCALVTAETDEEPETPLVNTTGWGYLRLRREAYADEQLADWVEKIKSQHWSEVYVFFKHEDAGTGPKLAARFLELT
jgi:uncharacterized protein YecE (DUF72 family)